MTEKIEVTTTSNNFQHTIVGEDALLTRNEVAELLNISLVTLHHHNKKGILKPTHKIGRRILYLKSAVLNAISLSNHNPLQLC